MTVHFAEAAAAARMVMADSDRLEQFCATAEFDQPTLVIDINRVEAQYHALKAGLGAAHIHYAVKANPQKDVIARLVKIGSRFDCASRGEIELCLSQGARPEHISYGNTIKRVSDIAYAYTAGIRLYAADAEEELDKIAEHAPGAEVYIRLVVEASEADWPLSRKFGCDGPTALRLLAYAKELGLTPRGFSFHVGSQTRRADMWAPILDHFAGVWAKAQEEGYALDLLNIGGGFPAFYGEEIDAPTDYAAKVIELVTARFGDVPYVMAEPGRGLVAEAGMIVSEVVLCSKKSARNIETSSIIKS